MECKHVSSIQISRLKFMDTIYTNMFICHIVNSRVMWWYKYKYKPKYKFMALYETHAYQPIKCIPYKWILQFEETTTHSHCQLISTVCHIVECKHCVDLSAMPVIFYRNFCTCVKDEGCPTMFDIFIIKFRRNFPTSRRTFLGSRLCIISDFILCNCQSTYWKAISEF